MNRPFSLENLAAAVMARAVLADMAAGRQGAPAPYRTAKRFGLRAEQVRALWDGRFERVGSRALSVLAASHGGRIATRHGLPVLVATGDYRPAVPDLGLTAKPVSPAEALARARDGAGGEHGAAMGRAEFSIRMKGAL